MPVHFVNTAPKNLKKKQVKAWIESCISHHKKECGTISIVFMTDEELLSMNRQFLEHDYFTDIITFPDIDGNTINGDLCISVDRIKDNAEQFHVPFEQELHRIIIHGVLHLLGHDDSTPEKRAAMSLIENKWLARL